MIVNSRILVPLAALAFGVAASATAQQPAPAAAVDVPPINCEKPTPLLEESPSNATIARQQKRLEAYKNCVNDYVKTNSEKAQELVGQANAYRDAANKAIDQYNAYATELNARTKQ